MNEKYLRDQLRDIEILKIKNRKNRQSNCSHLKGSSSDLTCGYGKDLAFHLLKLPTGEIVGVCPYCQKLISSIDPSDAKFFEGISPGQTTNAGVGQFLPDDDDKLFKQLARYTPEEKDRILKETISELKKLSGVKSKPVVNLSTDPTTHTADLMEMPMEDLKVLAQQYVDETFPEAKRKK